MMGAGLDKIIQRVAVVGLGKLGSCVAGCLVARGFDVIATDTDPAKVKAVSQGSAPVDEPGLQEVLSQGRSRLRATGNIRELVENSQAAFFIVPTLSQPDGSFSNEFLIRALQTVGTEIRALNKRGYLFVVNSTTTPGAMDAVIRPLLEEVTGGKDFSLCYNPEFIALGEVVKGLLQPDFILIGESDPAAGEALAELYGRLCTNKPPVRRMSLINAELAKISVNCAVTMKISFVNQLSEVCSRIPGADAGVILEAIGSDRRIGREYLKPGLGFGGPCFPRDNRLFQYVAKQRGTDAPLAEATDRVNQRVNERLLNTVLAHARTGSPVSVLGLAYKPFSNVVEQAAGTWLCQQLVQLGREVWAHDYMVSRAALNGMDGLKYESDLAALLGSGPETLVITCPWPAYRQAFSDSLPAWRRPATVIDPWRLLEGVAQRFQNIAYLTELQ